jgi:hypothetical protein
MKLAAIILFFDDNPRRVRVISGRLLKKYPFQLKTLRSQILQETWSEQTISPLLFKIIWVKVIFNFRLPALNSQT